MGGLDNGLRLVGVHATPDRDDGAGIHVGCTDEELDRMLEASSADVLCAGHTHHALLRSVPRGTVVNLGSLSNPQRDTDGRASYAIVRCDGDHAVVDQRRVPYDHGAVIDMLLAQRHPAVGFIEDSYYAGRR